MELVAGLGLFGAITYLKGHGHSRPHITSATLHAGVHFPSPPKCPSGTVDVDGLCTKTCVGKRKLDDDPFHFFDCFAKMARSCGPNERFEGDECRSDVCRNMPNDFRLRGPEPTAYVECLDGAATLQQCPRHTTFRDGACVRPCQEGDLGRMSAHTYQVCLDNGEWSSTKSCPGTDIVSVQRRQCIPSTVCAGQSDNFAMELAAPLMRRSRNYLVCRGELPEFQECPSETDVYDASMASCRSIDVPRDLLDQEAVYPLSDTQYVDRTNVLHTQLPEGRVLNRNVGRFVKRCQWTGQFLSPNIVCNEDLEPEPFRCPQGRVWNAGRCLVDSMDPEATTESIGHCRTHESIETTYAAFTNEYLFCDGGMTRRGTCPDGEVYDDVESRCRPLRTSDLRLDGSVYPVGGYKFLDVGGTVREVQPGYKIDPRGQPRSQCNHPGEVLSAQEQTYIKCDELLRPIRRTCPPNHMATEAGVCVFAPCSFNRTGLYAVGLKTYYDCSKATLQTCPEGTFFIGGQCKASLCVGQPRGKMIERSDKNWLFSRQAYRCLGDNDFEVTTICQDKDEAFRGGVCVKRSACHDLQFLDTLAGGEMEVCHSGRVPLRRRDLVPDPDVMYRDGVVSLSHCPYQFRRQGEACVYDPCHFNASGIFPDPADARAYHSCGPRPSRQQCDELEYFLDGGCHPVGEDGRVPREYANQSQFGVREGKIHQMCHDPGQTWNGEHCVFGEVALTSADHVYPFSETLYLDSGGQVRRVPAGHWLDMAQGLLINRCEGIVDDMLTKFHNLDNLGENEYVHCVAGRPRVARCPADMLFDNSWRVCLPDFSIDHRIDERRYVRNGVVRTCEDGFAIQDQECVHRSCLGGVAGLPLATAYANKSSEYLRCPDLREVGHCPADLVFDRRDGCRKIDMCSDMLPDRVLPLSDTEYTSCQRPYVNRLLLGEELNTVTGELRREYETANPNIAFRYDHATGRQVYSPCETLDAYRDGHAYPHPENMFLFFRCQGRTTVVERCPKHQFFQVGGCVAADLCHDKPDGFQVDANDPLPYLRGSLGRSFRTCRGGVLQPPEPCPGDLELFKVDSCRSVRPSVDLRPGGHVWPLSATEFVDEDALRVRTPGPGYELNVQRGLLVNVCDGGPVSVPYNQDQTRYLDCQTGKPVLKSCGSNEIFAGGNCAWRPCSVNQSPPDTHFALDHQRYVVCPDDGQVITCPGFYDPVTRVCVTEGECVLAPNSKHPVSRPAFKYSQEFVECIDGRRHVRSCPAGQLFDGNGCRAEDLCTDLKRNRVKRLGDHVYASCLVPRHVVDPGYVVTDEGLVKALPQPCSQLFERFDVTTLTCVYRPCLNAGYAIVHFPAQDDETTYWDCSTDQPTLESCPQGERFEPMAGRCRAIVAANRCSPTKQCSEVAHVPDARYLRSRHYYDCVLKIQRSCVDPYKVWDANLERCRNLNPCADSSRPETLHSLGGDRYVTCQNSRPKKHRLTANRQVVDGVVVDPCRFQPDYFELVPERNAFATCINGQYAEIECRHNEVPDIFGKKCMALDVRVVRAYASMEDCRGQERQPQVCESLFSHGLPLEDGVSMRYPVEGRASELLEGVCRHQYTRGVGCDFDINVYCLDNEVFEEGRCKEQVCGANQAYEHVLGSVYLNCDSGQRENCEYGFSGDECLTKRPADCIDKLPVPLYPLRVTRNWIECDTNTIEQCPDPSEVWRSGIGCTKQEERFITRVDPYTFRSRDFRQDMKVAPGYSITKKSEIKCHCLFGKGEIFGLEHPALPPSPFRNVAVWCDENRRPQVLRCPLGQRFREGKCGWPTLAELPSCGTGLVFNPNSNECVTNGCQPGQTDMALGGGGLLVSRYYVDCQMARTRMCPDPSEVHDGAGCIKFNPCYHLISGAQAYVDGHTVSCPGGQPRRVAGPSPFLDCLPGATYLKSPDTGTLCQANGTSITIPCQGTWRNFICHE